MSDGIKQALAIPDVLAVAELGKVMEEE